MTTNPKKLLVLWLYSLSQYIYMYIYSIYHYSSHFAAKSDERRSVFGNFTSLKVNTAQDELMPAQNSRFFLYQFANDRYTPWDIGVRCVI